jgi:hypothetical protein
MKETIRNNGKQIRKRRKHEINKCNTLLIQTCEIILDYLLRVT